ncbi:MAG: response regulator [Gammaproteobacteria bacterium]|nr:response regulator [Gammaproteobacteria bacterium]
MQQAQKQAHILIVDDDREICSLLSRFLSDNHIRTSVAYNAAEAENKLAAGRFDLIVLDLMMPGEDGLSFCRRWRMQSEIPVIMLTAMGEDTDRIIGLEMGADDYLPKPFNPRELLARIRAVLRRLQHVPKSASEHATHSFRFEGWRLDAAKRELHNPDGVLVSLTSGEFDLLQTFVEHPQRILNRDQLLDLTKGRDSIPFDRSIDVQLSRLRQKIEHDPKQPQLIKTIRNSGYMFTPEVES